MSCSNRSSAEIFKSLTILELKEEGLTAEIIMNAWKKKMTAAHAAGSTRESRDEYMISVNNAKYVLLDLLGGNESAPAGSMK